MLEDLHSDYFYLFKNTFHVVFPVNICLGVLVILWNLVLLSYFYPRWRKLTPALFFMMGISDLTAAAGHLLFAIAGLVYIEKGERGIAPNVMTGVYVTYRFLALTGYSSSIFINTSLAILRTFQVVAPYRRVNTTSVKVVMCTLAVVLLSVTVCDIVICGKVGWLSIQKMRFGEQHDAMFAAINYPGQTITWLISSHIGHGARVLFETSLLVFFYILPVIIVVVCMIVQVLKTTRCCSHQDDEVPIMTNWIYVNTTVILLAAVFLVCNICSTSYALAVSGYRFSRHFVTKNVYLAIFSSTLPLFNALLSPIIIVTRSTNLKSYFVEKIAILILCRRIERLQLHEGDIN